MSRYLVVAHQTARSRELADAVRSLLARERDATFALLVPATPSHELLVADADAAAVAAESAEGGRKLLELLGASVVRATVGASSPLEAIEFELSAHPGEYDHIVLCTLPEGVSHWLRVDVLERVRRTSGLPVLHIVARLDSLQR